MAKDCKTLTVEVKMNKEIYSAIEEYSNHMNSDDKSIVSELINLALKDFERKYKNLKDGYVEMGNLNLEISDAFTVSENEAYGHIHKEP